jgi:organic hydroperoxide reductase OsmC/OhrA
VERDNFDVEVVGEIYNRDGVLVIERITAYYRLALPQDKRAEAERVHGFHARFCPVARSLEGGIEVQTELTLN